MDYPPKATIPVYNNGLVYVKALRLPKGVKLDFKNNDIFEKKLKEKSKSKFEDNAMENKVDGRRNDQDNRTNLQNEKEKIHKENPNLLGETQYDSKGRANPNENLLYNEQKEPIPNLLRHNHGTSSSTSPPKQHNNMNSNSHKNHSANFLIPDNIDFTEVSDKLKENNNKSNIKINPDLFSSTNSSNDQGGSTWNIYFPESGKKEEEKASKNKKADPRKNMLN